MEGHIEPNQYPYVLLTHNFAYFGNTSINNLLQQDVVHGATVTITNGTSTDTMRELFPTIGYYQALVMKGQIGSTYSITIVAQGQTLTSSTTIQQPIKLDSAWFQVQPGLDTLGYLWAIMQSPPPAGKCYRWLAKRLGKDSDFVAPGSSVFNDVGIVNVKFEFFYDRGVEPGTKNLDDQNAERHYFKIGETVVIKFATIDITSYNFYNQYYYQQGNKGNPFGSPAPVTGNIQGGLGIWCAYGSYLDTVKCK